MRNNRQAKPFCALCKMISDKLKDLFAPYVVIDCYGTDKLCWTMKEAESWLPYCSKSAYIMETYDYSVVVARKQNI